MFEVCISSNYSKLAQVFPSPKIQVMCGPLYFTNKHLAKMPVGIPPSENILKLNYWFQDNKFINVKLNSGYRFLIMDSYHPKYSKRIDSPKIIIGADINDKMPLSEAIWPILYRSIFFRMLHLKWTSLGYFCFNEIPT